MKLTKIKLINWHIFSNTTIELNGNTLITGENASGKSTLMDAIFYVLSGGDDKHFNKAANEMGKRDLEGYLRGKLGNENQMYLRSGQDVIGYVLLEFTDIKNQNSMVLGSELEIVSSTMKKPKFFVINHYSICDDDLIKNKQIVDFENLKLSFKSSEHPVDELSETKKERKKAIGRDIFKLDNYYRFFELLQNAISFKPIAEVSSFVNGFLLKEDNINLDSLRDEIRSYQNIHKMLIKENEKIDVLKDFIPKAEKYLKNLEFIKFLSALKVAIKVDKLNNQIKQTFINLERINTSYANLLNEEKMLRNTEKRLNVELYQLNNNETYKVLQEKKDKLKEYENELSKVLDDLKIFTSMINNEQSLARKFEMKYQFYEDLKSKDFGRLKAHLENYKDELSKKKIEIDNTIAKLQIFKNNNQEIIKDKILQLDNLKKGINNYPNDVYNLIEIAQNAILQANPKEKNPEVRPLCEYIEINDEKWTNALEGYLSTQRFNLIVEPKYYDIVSESYNKYKSERKVYIAGIVNASNIPPVKEVKNSMVTKIDISNKHAKKYVEYLLGNLVCVDDIKDLKNFDSSITSEVMIYKNYVLKACNPNTYKIPYIGKDSREKRQKLLENEITELKSEKEKIEKNIEKYSLLQDNASKTRINELTKYNNPWKNIELYEENITSIKNEIAANEKEFGLTEIANKIKFAENKLDEIHRDLSEKEKGKSDNQIEKGRLENKIGTARDNLTIENDDLKIALVNLNITEYNEMKSKYTNNGRLDEESITKDYLSLQSFNNAVKDNLNSTMVKYSTNYKASLVPIIENIKDFINEYYKLLNLDVVKYKQASKDAYEKAEFSFKEDFLSKIREKIEKSQKMLDKLNKNLQEHPFGNDEERYRFYYEPSKDFYNYYKIIMSGKLMNLKDLFTEILDEKDSSIIKDLFDKISMETDSSESEKELERYLDYRNYMNYDIIISNKEGDKSYFSKINKEKSGGETQTPFYIVIASCFDELSNKDNNKIESTCQVMFDEAFNNMDESRIKSLMEFYKNLNIQVFIIAPSNRIAPISPYMDTLVGITKIKNHPHIYTIGK